MAKKGEVGIVVRLTDNASEGLGKVREAVNNIGAPVMGAVDLLHKLEGAIGTVRLAWELFTGKIREAVNASLEFRDENDPVVKWFKQWDESVRAVSVAIGDLFIPILQGFAEGLGLVGNGIADWINKNRILIGTNIVEWAERLGQVLVKVVARGAWLSVAAWSGWQEIIALTTASFSKAFKLYGEGQAMILEAEAWIAEKLGQDALAEAWRNRAREARRFADAADEGADASIRAAHAAADAATEALTEIDEMEIALSDRITDAAAKATEAIIKFASATKKEMGQANAAVNVNLMQLDAFLNAVNANTANRVAAIDAEMAAELERAKLMDAVLTDRDAKNRASSQQTIDAFGAVGEGFMEMAQTQGDAQKEAAKAMLGTIADMAIKAIAVYATEAAANAMATVPFPANFAISALVGASVAALGAGIKGAIGGMAEGGFVTGGTQGRDSVPKMLMPGELVLSTAEVPALQKLMSRFVAQGDAAQFAQTAGAGGPVGAMPAQQAPVTIQNQMWSPDQITMDRMTRRQQRSIKRLRRTKMLAE